MLRQGKSIEEGAIRSLQGVGSTEEGMSEVGLVGQGGEGEGRLEFPPAVRWHFRKGNSASKDLEVIKCPGCLACGQL